MTSHIFFLLRKWFVRLSLLFLIGICIPFHYTNNIFRSYRDEFLTLNNQFCPNRKFYNLQTWIVFKHLSDPKIGLCLNYLTGFVIFIDPTYWQFMSDDQRYALLMHEMSHCYLHINHSDDRHNYMYFEENNLPKDQVKLQLYRNILDTCE